MSERDIDGQAFACTEPTENDVASLRVRNLTGYILGVKRGASTASTAMDGSIRLRPHDIFFEKIGDLWSGGSGNRIWGFGTNEIPASVSHE